MSEVVEDEVEDFTLDEDFDYDNVILTPKFPPEEQAVLDELARKGREERVKETFLLIKHEYFRYI